MRTDCCGQTVAVSVSWCALMGYFAVVNPTQPFCEANITKATNSKGYCTWPQ